MPDNLMGSAHLAACNPTRWYVVFCATGQRRWWDRLFRTPSDFSHVYALRWDGWNWILFNPGAAFTQLEILPHPTENALQAIIEPEATVLEVQAFRRDGLLRGRWWAGPMTCVEQIKALLGLPVGRIWTPWQLYRYLMRFTDGIPEVTESTGANGPGSRARRAPAPRVKQIDRRRKPQAEADQARHAGPSSTDGGCQVRRPQRCAVAVVKAADLAAGAVVMAAVVAVTLAAGPGLHRVA